MNDSTDSSGAARDTTSRASLLVLALFVVGCLAVASLGAAITAGSVSDWYPTLNKPAFNPPDWLFGPVWTVLFICMGIAGWRVWHHRHHPARRMALSLFAAQLILNFLWSCLFFGLRSPGLALLEIGLFWIVLTATLLVFRRVDRIAAWLFVPYLAWVSFACLLNWAIWRLN